MPPLTEAPQSIQETIQTDLTPQLAQAREVINRLQAKCLDLEAQLANVGDPSFNDPPEVKAYLVEKLAAGLPREMALQVSRAQYRSDRAAAKKIEEDEAKKAAAALEKKISDEAEAKSKADSANKSQGKK